MNIFYLDSNPKVAAQYHCDKHCVKMILETSQMLSTALHLHGCTTAPIKISFKNHPSTVWTRATQSNYLWMCFLLEELCKEFRHRYQKEHYCEQFVEYFFDNAHYIPLGFFTDPPQCMPKECKRETAVEAYRTYYIEKKAYFAKWKCGNIPHWWPFKTLQHNPVQV